MNVLIINLTRFGDLLQLQPTILGLQAKGHKVGLVCLENFYAATVLLRGLDYVVALPGSKFLHAMDKDWRLALQKIEDLVQNIQNNFHVDTIINTTSTLGARLLSKRLMEINNQSVNLLGFGLDADGFGISGDKWATFLHGSSMERINCPFNLVDMFRAICDVATPHALWGLEPPNDEIKIESFDLLTKAKPLKCKGFIAFQLGASNAKRQWPVEYFAKLGAKIWQEQGLCPVLLGIPKEQGLGQMYADLAKDFSHPFINVIGKTDIPHLAGILSHCKMIISNDTGTMHLAAGLKIPVLAIFLATAQAWDTGPYMPDCCCLEPAMPCHPCAFHTSCTHGEDKQPCLRKISVNTVYYLAGHYLQQGSWPRHEQDEVRVWRSFEETNGFACLEGLSGHENEERSQWLMMQRYFYRRILDKHVDDSKPPKIDALSLALRDEVQKKLQQVSDLLLLLEKQIQVMQVMPNSQNGERILITTNKIKTIFQNSKNLKALEHLWVTFTQDYGADLTCFSDLAVSLREIFMHWQKTIAISGT